jgi:type III secretion protein V
MTASLRALLHRIPFTPDVMIAAVLVLTVAMMILPMPHFVVDLLIGFNLGFAMLLLMVGLYIRSPLDFSTLPGIILISTVFRLALTITTTRLILSEGDAGHIVRTFGEFVVAGSVIVGLVIFLIITLVQFIVVAKGAERVAEVGARFTLDALPGKQMAIDAELRNGDIDHAEARRRRRTLEKESSFFGAMDGAMKFVKGDAIAGLVVIAVNIIGGITIGVVTRGMSVGEAVREYTLLSVGDALIAQIPALLMAITAGTIVTRVGGETSKANDLGADIVGQLSADRRALRLAAIVMLGMALVPGFPVVVFLLLAAAFGIASFLAGQRDSAIDGNGLAMAPRPGEVGTAITQDLGSMRTVAPIDALPIILCLSPSLHRSLEPSEVTKVLENARTAVSDDLGILAPEVGVQIDDGLEASSYQIVVDGVPVVDGLHRPHFVLLKDDIAHLELLGVPFESDDENGQPGSGKVWISSDYRPQLDSAGIGHQTSGEAIASGVRDVLFRHVSRFVGIQETKALLSKYENRYGELVREALRHTSVQKIADILRRLLDEGVSVRNMRVVLESLAEWGEKESNVVLLAEYVRSGLKRQICHRYANDHRVVGAYVLERSTEEILRAAVRDTAVGPYLVLDEKNGERFLAAARRIAELPKAESRTPVMLASMDIRRFVRGFLIRNGLDIPVLSYQDLAVEFTIQPVGTLTLLDTAPSESSAGTARAPMAAAT